jgi:hypothetical protein
MMCTHAGVVSVEECPYCNSSGLITDTQRLDWLAKAEYVIQGSPQGFWIQERNGSGDEAYMPDGYFPTYREAIDMAMREGDR